jgi:DNA-binding NtrC family response regulator
MSYKIMMVDDNLQNLSATKDFLEAAGYEVATATTLEKAIELLNVDEFALILLDYQMPDMMGNVVAERIKKEYPAQQIAMFSCDLSREALKDSLDVGVVGFIEKSVEPFELLERVERYCRRFELLVRTIRPTRSKSANRNLIEAVGMVGHSQAMAGVAAKVQKIAAASDTSVLIRGESGTGKELVARALHSLSARRKGPFVAINCAAIPKDLLESELFGHKKGAFTGAIDNKLGKIAAADGGTLFLDEIGDMAFDLQTKLLRVLQERTIEPLGSRTSQKVDVRVLSATHQNVEELVKKKLFREDLMYRIKVVEIDLPPLRDRVEDIEPLVGHFTAIFNEKHKTNKYFQRRTLDVLKRYSWPGNVRELQGVVESQLVFCDGAAVRPDDLDLKLYQPDSGTRCGLTYAQFKAAHEKEEREFLQAVIAQAGSKAEAARRLEVKPTHLQYLIN